MLEQRQGQANEAAEEFVATVRESSQAVAERIVSAQERNVQLTQQFFDGVTNNLRTQAEDNRQMARKLAGQQRRALETGQSLAQESVGAYMAFINSMFSYYHAGSSAVERSVGESAEEVRRTSTEAEVHDGEHEWSAREVQRNPRENIRSIIRESVEKSEAGIGEEPQVDGGTTASEESRASVEEPPMEDYDSLNVGQISERLEGLSVDALEQLRRYEAANKNRSTLHRRIDDTIAARNT